MENLININKKLEHRILKNPLFINNPNKKLKLSDPIVLYNDGANWKLIPLNIFRMYPVIHDVYYEMRNDNAKKMLENLKNK